MTKTLSSPTAKRTSKRPSASQRATKAVRKGKLLSAKNPKDRSPKQENL